MQHVIGARILAPVRGKEPPHFLCFLRRNGTVKCAEVEILSRSARNGGLLHMRRRGVHIPELLFRNVYPVERLRIAGAQNGFNGESRFLRALGGAAHERGFPVAGAALDVPDKRAVLRRGKRRIERDEPRAGICAEEKLPGIFCSITMHTLSMYQDMRETENTTQKTLDIFPRIRYNNEAVFGKAALVGGASGAL